MRVMVMILANQETETGKPPSEQLLREMGEFNEQLVKAGIMLGGEGLKASSTAKRVRFTGQKRSVIDGPFAEAKEVIAGYWLWKVKSMEEAVEWVKRIPNPDNGDADVEIRPLVEAEEFGPEAAARDERLRAELARDK